jgi:23S rRNA (pseudouridine1915-N3)-methyltransferase
MKIRLIVIGKTEEEFLRTGIREYTGRVNRYVPFVITEIPALRGASALPQPEQVKKEGELLARQLQPGDIVVVLDERGREMRSSEFAGFLNRQFLSGSKQLVFIIGGPFGFDEEIKKKASVILSLSRMTFSHQMVRLFFTEQLYRALTILRGESYHHE